MNRAAVAICVGMLGATWLSAPIVAQPRVGEAAPSIGVEEVIAGPEPAQIDLDALRGQAVVIEFWATWCGPCIGVLDHWNELAVELEGEPIRFLSVSDESAETVREFLEGREMRGWIALDIDRSMYADYGINGIPHTFLIDAEGTLRAETYPSSVTLDALRGLIAGEAIDLPSATSFDDRVATRLKASGGPEAVLLAEVRPSTDPELRGMKTTARETLHFGRSALDSIVIAFEGSSTRVELGTELPGQLYDFVFRSPGDHEDRQRMMRTAVRDAFGITVEREPRLRRVFELRLLEGRQIGLTASPPGAGGFSTYAGGIKGRGLDLTSLANALEFVVGIPVLDATGLQGRFDVGLDWKAEEDGDLERALAEIGLQLTSAEREIEVLVVRPDDR